MDRFQFYDDVLDEEDYDAKMIDDLFKPKTKKTGKDENCSETDEFSDDDLLDEMLLGNKHPTVQKQYSQYAAAYPEGSSLRRQGTISSGGGGGTGTPLPQQKTVAYKIGSYFAKKIGTKSQIKTHPLIDFFEPIENENRSGMLQNIGGAMMKGTKSLTQMVIRDVPTIHNNDIRYDELGYVNYTGFIQKRRGNMDAFHQRFVVLRGFDLYWFRVDDSDKSGEFKEKVTLPSLPTHFDLVVKNQRCFTVEKDSDVEGSRKLVFLENDKDPDF